ncbi:PDZ domain-containing protein [Paenibacillus caui]|uniref:PDZ domain-containing protein n=1 Tax=Paenibacillus caui TaxID=2873927 RepID=UPI001CA94015|nr:PDZ domain-containing protein [Paenibacillus caui]
MDVLMEWLWNFTEASVKLLLQPFYYISIILITLQYRRQVLLERKLFHARLHRWGLQTWRTFLGGLLAGLAVSVIFLFLGMTLSTEGILLLWASSLLLMLLRVRYLCLAYAAGLLGVVQFVVSLFPADEAGGFSGQLLTAVSELNIPALLGLAGLLHVAEALLVRWQGASFAGPLFYEGKRGRPVGGYQMQSLWPIPLFLLIPAQTAGSVLPWTPVFGGDAWQGGFALIGLPVMIGFSEMTISLLPEAKTRLTSSRVLFYGLLVLGMALIARWWSPFTLAAAILAFALHEGLIWYSRFEEQNRSPFFVHPQRGLKVLAVLPDSPAAELGITAGEVIVRVNGVDIGTKEQLHEALRINSAFCKLEVLNLDGESKFLQRAIYAGEHHQLGVILAPDEDAPAVVRSGAPSLLQLLSPKRSAERRDGSRQRGKAERGAGREKPAKL